MLLAPVCHFTHAPLISISSPYPLLSFLALSSLALSFSFLSFPFLSFPLLSSPVLSFPVLSFPLLSSPFLSFPLLSSPLLSFPLLSSPLLSSLLFSSVTFLLLYNPSFTYLNLRIRWTSKLWQGYIASDKRNLCTSTVLSPLALSKRELSRGKNFIFNCHHSTLKSILEDY